MYDELVKRLRDDVGIDGRAEMMKQAADAIEELSVVVRAQKAVLDKFPKWIPVTERLPEDIDEEVLVCTEDYGVSGLGFVTVATYGVSGWLECWERKTYLTAVTHWMPLPQPPKEE